MLASFASCAAATRLVEGIHGRLHRNMEGFKGSLLVAARTLWTLKGCALALAMVQQGTCAALRGDGQLMAGPPLLLCLPLPAWPELPACVPKRSSWVRRVHMQAAHC